MKNVIIFAEKSRVYERERDILAFCVGKRNSMPKKAAFLQWQTGVSFVYNGVKIQ